MPYEVRQGEAAEAFLVIQCVDCFSGIPHTHIITRIDLLICKKYFIVLYRVRKDEIRKRYLLKRDKYYLIEERVLDDWIVLVNSKGSGVINDEQVVSPLLTLLVNSL